MNGNKIIVFFVSSVLLLSGVFGLFMSAKNQEATINQAKYDSLSLELKSLQTTYNNSQKSFDNLLKQKKVEVEQLETELNNVRGKLQQANVKISTLEDELEYTQAAWYHYLFLDHPAAKEYNAVFIWEHYTKPLLFPDSNVYYLLIMYPSNQEITVELLDSFGKNILPGYYSKYSSTDGMMRIDFSVGHIKVLSGTYLLRISGVTWYTIWGMVNK